MQVRVWPAFFKTPRSHRWPTKRFGSNATSILQNIPPCSTSGLNQRLLVSRAQALFAVFNQLQDKRSTRTHPPCTARHTKSGLAGSFFAIRARRLSMGKVRFQTIPQLRLKEISHMTYAIKNPRPPNSKVRLVYHFPNF